MDDSRKTAYADAVAVSADNFLKNLKTHSQMVFCSPDGKEERSISHAYEGEAFVVLKADRKMLMDDIRNKATGLNQRPPDDLEWSEVFSHFDVEVERVVLSNEDGGMGSPILGVQAGVAAGVALSGLTFGISLVAGPLLGAWLGMNRQEKKQRSARNANRQKITNLHEKAIIEMQSRRQQIIDAILACNY